MNSFSIAWNANEIFALNPSYTTEKRLQVKPHLNSRFLFGLYIVCTWRHEMAAMLVTVPDQSWETWTLFLIQRFLLFQEIDMAVGHVSETLYWNKERDKGMDLNLNNARVNHSWTLPYPSENVLFFLGDPRAKPQFWNRSTTWVG